MQIRNHSTVGEEARTNPSPDTIKHTNQPTPPTNPGASETPVPYVQPQNLTLSPNHLSTNQINKVGTREAKRIPII